MGDGKIGALVKANTKKHKKNQLHTNHRKYSVLLLPARRFRIEEYPYTYQGYTRLTFPVPIRKRSLLSLPDISIRV